MIKEDDSLKKYLDERFAEQMKQFYKVFGMFPKKEEMESMGLPPPKMSPAKSEYEPTKEEIENLRLASMTNDPEWPDFADWYNEYDGSVRDAEAAFDIWKASTISRPCCGKYDDCTNRCEPKAKYWKKKYKDEMSVSEKKDESVWCFFIFDRVDVGTNCGVYSNSISSARKILKSKFPNETIMYINSVREEDVMYGVRIA